jgi:hypothetical protein
MKCNIVHEWAMQDNAHTLDIPHYEIMKTLRLFHDVKNGLGLYIGRENTESRQIRVSRGWHDSFAIYSVSIEKTGLANFQHTSNRRSS